MLTPIALVFSLLTFDPASIQDTVPTDSLTKTGWLVAYRNEMVWAPANVSKNTNPAVFFNTIQYLNGIYLGGSDKVDVYKKIATRFTVKDQYNKREKNIYIVRVKVTLQIIKSPMISEITGWFFEKDGFETSVIFRQADKYMITEIDLLNRKDRTQFKKLLKKFKPNPLIFEQHVP